MRRHRNCQREGMTMNEQPPSVPVATQTLYPCSSKSLYSDHAYLGWEINRSRSMQHVVGAQDLSRERDVRCVEYSTDLAVTRAGAPQ